MRLSWLSVVVCLCCSLASGAWDCPATGGSLNDWRYSEPTCGSLTVTYPSNLPAGQSNDVNIRFRRADGSEFTLNFHNNNGYWTGTVVFTYNTHPNWPAGLTVYAVVWIQVAGSNCHWSGNLQCGGVTAPPPVPCVGSWSAWSDCSKSCGIGGRTRTFTITTPASNGGPACDFNNGDTQSQACNTQPCPVNCVGAWSSWSGCNLPCGGGFSFRIFTIVTVAANGGAACVAANGDVQSQGCNTQPCPVNCVGSWSAWGACSRTCGGGTNTRTFTITTPAANGGTACSATNGQTESRACNTQACQVGGPPGSGFDCQSPPGSFWDWRYPIPTCTALTVIYPADLPSGQANDVNIRFRRPDGSEFTLNFHLNSGFWSGTTVFTYSTHPNWPAGLTVFSVVWVQVAGSNCHWSGVLQCGILG